MGEMVETNMVSVIDINPQLNSNGLVITTNGLMVTKSEDNEFFVTNVDANVLSLFSNLKKNQYNPYLGFIESFGEVTKERTTSVDVNQRHPGCKNQLLKYTSTLNLSKNSYDTPVFFAIPFLPVLGGGNVRVNSDYLIDESAFIDYLESLEFNATDQNYDPAGEPTIEEVDLEFKFTDIRDIRYKPKESKINPREYMKLNFEENGDLLSFYHAPVENDIVTISNYGQFKIFSNGKTYVRIPRMDSGYTAPKENFVVGEDLYDAPALIRKLVKDYKIGIELYFEGDLDPIMLDPTLSHMKNGFVKLKKGGKSRFFGVDKGVMELGDLTNKYYLKNGNKIFTEGSPFIGYV